MQKFDIFKEDSASDFYDEFDANDKLKNSFPMTLDYFTRSDCYSDDSFITCYTVDTLDQSFVAIFSIKNQPRKKGYTHISTFEIDKDLHGIGLGTNLLQELIKQYGKISLMAEEKNWKFYENLGFKKDFSEDSRGFFFTIG